MPKRIRENTLPGFAMALELGADGIELDVHATRDGTIVVHHDPILSDGAAIAELTAEQLRQREAAPCLGIPTLAEVCDLVAGRGTLFVEIKGEGIEMQVLAALANYRGAAAIHSFDHSMIAHLYTAQSPHPLGVLLEEPMADIAQIMATTGATDVWPHFSLVTPALAGQVHELGGRLIPWTVNDAALARTLANDGADGLCGDDITIFA